MKRFFKNDKTISQVKNWYQDRYETVLIQRNVLFLIVLGLVVIFGITITSVVELNSKKVYEPYIVQIEENTGIITKVNNAQIREIPAEKAIRNSALVRYVLAREGYNYTDYKYNHNTIVRLFSGDEVYKQFWAVVEPKNPNSPVNYGVEQRVDVKIKSIIDLDERENLVQIRISKERYRSGSVEKNFEASYIITLKYDYFDLNLDESKRYVNPLGMQIVGYKIDEEQNAKKI